jgi:hypothetical protein
MLRNLLWATLLGLLPTHLLAQAGSEYSATAVRSNADGKEVMTFKMHVGADGMLRKEGTRDGQQVVQITVPAQGVMWVLYPDRKSYTEWHRTPTPPPDATNPCSGRKDLTCTLLGSERISGRPAKKWEIDVNAEGEHHRGLQWVDEERGMILRQESPEGHITEMKLVGQEKISGRQVEKWEMTMTPASDTIKPVHLTKWYDPALGVDIRQELPDGGISELRGIRVAPQPKKLFRVPEDYRPVQPKPPAE